MSRFPTLTRSWDFKISVVVWRRFPNRRMRFLLLDSNRPLFDVNAMLAVVRSYFIFPWINPLHPLRIFDQVQSWSSSTSISTRK